ncbi:MAG: BlaI/MecI/CopY family transcriptional regulator [Bacteroidetes bacterium]|nr:BlaI/MecI/CopY family transcriptional regulator [Bacteroidota bacterium]MDA1120159.1 BlaI/MecI/CopY family transcriptional regulator [Bacteroidota bacterium]
MKELTKAEEQVMQVLWKLEKGFVNDILDHFPVPKPAYNTASTISRILVKKGFVAFKAFGNSHQYYPVISRKEYKHFCLKNIVGNYFDGSFEELVSFFARENNLNVSELDELMSHVQQDLKNKTDDGN